MSVGEAAPDPEAPRAGGQVWAAAKTGRTSTAAPGRAARAPTLLPSLVGSRAGLEPTSGPCSRSDYRAPLDERQTWPPPARDAVRRRWGSRARTRAQTQTVARTRTLAHSPQLYRPACRPRQVRGSRVVPAEAWRVTAVGPLFGAGWSLTLPFKRLPPPPLLPFPTPTPLHLSCTRPSGLLVRWCFPLKI